MLKMLLAFFKRKRKETIPRDLQNEILKDEFTNDLMYQPSMDTAYINSLKRTDGYYERNFNFFWNKNDKNKV